MNFASVAERGLPVRTPSRPSANGFCAAARSTTKGPDYGRATVSITPADSLGDGRPPLRQGRKPLGFLRAANRRQSVMCNAWRGAGRVIGHPSPGRGYGQRDPSRIHYR